VSTSFLIGLVLSAKFGYIRGIFVLSAKSRIYQRNFRFIIEILDLSAKFSFYRRNPGFISEIFILSAKSRIYQRNFHFIGEIPDLSAKFSFYRRIAYTHKTKKALLLIRDHYWRYHPDSKQSFTLIP